MKVALVGFGGHERYSIQLANGLAVGAEVLLVVPDTADIEFEELLDERIVLFRYRQPRMRYPTNLLAVRSVVKRIKAFGADVVHFQGEHSWFFAGLPFLKRTGIVTTFHDVSAHPGEEKIRYKWNKWWFRKYSDRIIVHGHQLKKLMITTHGLRDERIAVIPHGSYDLYSRWKDPEMAEDGGIVLFFGRLWRYKGLDYLIKAEPLISKEIPDLRIVVAIHGEPFSNYEKDIENRDRFEVLERFIPNEEVATLFQRASVVALPYIEASQSGVLNIAYVFEKPVVVTDVGSLPEAVDDGKTGFIVPPGDPKALAEAIITLLKDPESRKEMGKNAYIKATTEFSWDRIAETTIASYAEIIDAVKGDKEGT